MENKYKHKLSGEILTLKKDFGRVAVFIIPEENRTVIYGNVVIDTCVCVWDNILKCDNLVQQKLF